MCHDDCQAGLWHRCHMARDDPKFIVRLPPDLKDRIEAEARAKKRSMNAEMVARLAASFQPADPPEAPSVIAQLLELFQNREIAEQAIRNWSLVRTELVTDGERKMMAALASRNLDSSPFVAAPPAKPPPKKKP